MMTRDGSFLYQLQLVRLLQTILRKRQRFHASLNVERARTGVN